MVRLEIPPRLLWIGATVAGTLHLLAPGLLLWAGRWSYRLFLRVDFDPKPGAKRRVRVVGLGFLAVAAVLRRYTGDST